MSSFFSSDIRLKQCYLLLLFCESCDDLRMLAGSPNFLLFRAHVRIHTYTCKLRVSMVMTNLNTFWRFCEASQLLKKKLYVHTILTEASCSTPIPRLFHTVASYVLKAPYFSDCGAILGLRERSSPKYLS